MSILTNRLRLKKSEATDPLLRQDFVDNYDKMDAFPGDFICTSTTRPAWNAAQAGMHVWETDSRRRFEWTGTAWQADLSLPTIKRLFVAPKATIGRNTNTYLGIGTVVVDRPSRLNITLAVVYSVDSFGRSGPWTPKVYTWPFVDNVDTTTDTVADQFVVDNFTGTGPKSSQGEFTVEAGSSGNNSPGNSAQAIANGANFMWPFYKNYSNPTGSSATITYDMEAQFNRATAWGSRVVSSGSHTLGMAVGNGGMHPLRVDTVFARVELVNPDS